MVNNKREHPQTPLSWLAEAKYEKWTVEVLELSVSTSQARPGMGDGPKHKQTRNDAWLLRSSEISVWQIRDYKPFLDSNEKAQINFI